MTPQNKKGGTPIARCATLSHCFETRTSRARTVEGIVAHICDPRGPLSGRLAVGLVLRESPHRGEGTPYHFLWGRTEWAVRLSALRFRHGPIETTVLPALRRWWPGPGTWP